MKFQNITDVANTQSVQTETRKRNRRKYYEKQGESYETARAFCFVFTGNILTYYVFYENSSVKVENIKLDILVASSHQHFCQHGCEIS